ncbi:nucleoside deaminase [Fibrella forsythiae]|uniref:Nucleoside deaminase n=1 Tax=Fibrella forsythiae TaxID=2817061 RepID=A0ABS3JL51_9BACT|nr:nucleoside deaminase [Fibrella forsythiae]MBO0950730.1 nucleoside deaminase [Fibrella forsythiae]
MINEQDTRFLRRAIALAREGMLTGRGGPFGAVVVKDGEIIGESSNCVTSTNDPTAHAEVMAIRAACATLGTFQLDGCTLYTSCEPCPMCLGAIYWARPARVLYAAEHTDAAIAGFDDSFIYAELAKPYTHRSIPTEQSLQNEAKTVFIEWADKHDKVAY